jgi:xylulokinase
LYLLGLDIGSSSVKASLVDAHTAKFVASVQSPADEMDILAVKAGWAEQHPELWWKHCCLAIKKLLQTAKIKKTEVLTIGISYQMHGLVALDKAGNVVRPSIIWCDSRAVEIGNKAFKDLGETHCLQHYLNSPGNFTASKLKWVEENEPYSFSEIHKIMLPGDYIAYKLTDEMLTTVSGLSEGVLWDFKEHTPANALLDYYGIPKSMIPDLTPTFASQGTLTQKAALETGLHEDVEVTYRAGDQPNNALSLNVLNPGEVAATGGTSGVVYGVVDKLIYDPQNRINSFAHVNYKQETPRIGVLLCINGAGIQYSWTRKNLATEGTSYPELEKMAKKIPVGSDGLRIIPFGNGAERMLGNQNLGAQIHNLHFNRHGKAHFYRASLEGVAFSFVYGMKILQELGMNVSVLRVGNDNLFQSEIFSSSISTLLNCKIEMLSTTGATGAAIASGVGIGRWKEASEGMNALKLAGKYEPKQQNKAQLDDAYQDWASKIK